MIVSYNPLRLFPPARPGAQRARRRQLAYDCIADDFAVAINTLVILLAVFNVFSIGLLADLVGRSPDAAKRCRGRSSPQGEPRRSARPTANRRSRPWPRSDLGPFPPVYSVATVGAA